MATVRRARVLAPVTGWGTGLARKGQYVCVVEEGRAADRVRVRAACRSGQASFCRTRRVPAVSPLGWSDLLPWVVFAVVDRKTGLGVGWAGVCAVACAVALMAWGYWWARPSPVRWLAAGLFGATAAVGFTQTISIPYALPRAAVFAVLGATALVSSAGRPLSAVYSWPDVPSEQRRDGRFHRANVDITVVWGVAALCAATSFASLQVLTSAVDVTVFGWLVPLGVAAGTLAWTTRRWSLYCADIDDDTLTEPGGLALFATDADGSFVDRRRQFLKVVRTDADAEHVPTTSPAGDR